MPTLRSLMESLSEVFLIQTVSSSITDLIFMKAETLCVMKFRIILYVECRGEREKAAIKLFLFCLFHIVNILLPDRADIYMSNSSCGGVGWTEGQDCRGQLVTSITFHYWFFKWCISSDQQLLRGRIRWLKRWWEEERGYFYRWESRTRSRWNLVWSSLHLD